MDICTEIQKTLPSQIIPVFEKGKHLTFEEALLKLSQILG
jgi:hypothetical protein